MPLLVTGACGTPAPEPTPPPPEVPKTASALGLPFAVFHGPFSNSSQNSSFFTTNRELTSLFQYSPHSVADTSLVGRC